MPQCDQEFLYSPFVVPKIITTHHFNQKTTMDTSTSKPDANDCCNNCNTNSSAVRRRCDITLTDSHNERTCYYTEDSYPIPPKCFCAKNRSASSTRMPSGHRREHRRSPSPFRRSPSPMCTGGSYAGYEQYSNSLLSVPFIPEYGDASSDDLSSEWDSDVPDVPPPPPPKTTHKV